jgi:quinoprotein glucose dehydrogenase
MSVDEDMGLVFLPTSSPSPDFWGGKRPGNNEHAGSVVALRAQTGESVWAFQTVYHNVWDYDLPAQPTVAHINTEAGGRDVVIQPTKQGLLFVLDKGTGQPVWPVEERPVPRAAPTASSFRRRSRFRPTCHRWSPQRISADDAFGLFSRACHDKLARARNDGLYTPPSIQGTLVFPFTAGGVNWGGDAFDPVNQILYAAQ